MNDNIVILLVEDEPVVAMAEAEMLKRNGYEVLTAQSGKEALEIFKQNTHIDLVLMDIDLGEGMDGTEAAERILKIKEIPIVFLSAHTEPEIVAKTEKITSYGYVVKASGETVLLASIKMAFRLFEAKRALDEKNAELASANEELQSAFEELEAANEEFEAANEELIQTNAEIEKRERLLMFLNDVSKSLAAHIDVRGAVETILDALLELEGIDCGGIYVRDLDTGNLDLIIHKGLSKEFAMRVSHFGRDSRNIQIAMQGPQYANYQDIVDKSDDVRVKEGLRAIAILPVFHAGRLVSVLNLASHTEDVIAPGVRSYLEAIAMQVGSALHRIAVFEKLQKSEARFRGLINSMNEGFCFHELVYDEHGTPVDYRILDVNLQYEKMTGISSKDAIGALASELYGAKEPPYLSIYADVVFSGKGRIFETYFPPIDRHYRISAYSPEERHFATVFRDITEQKKEEEEIQSLVFERDMMLRELQHRIKNNFSMMASLVSWEAGKTENPEILEILNRIQTRAIIMSDLYSILYEKGISKEVHLAEFFRVVVDTLKKAYLPADARISVETSLEDFPLEMKASSALGLMLNELFANAVKHAFPDAFPDARKGGIAISISLSEGTGVLHFSDNGIGLPERFSPDVASGSGLRLMLALVRQIRGEISFERINPGTAVRVRFPVVK